MTHFDLDFRPADGVSRRHFLQAGAAASAAVLLNRGPIARGDDAPLRDGKRLRVHTREPLNAEPHLIHLHGEWLTPVAQFYVRTHGNTPTIAPPNYRLTVEGMVERSVSFGLDDLRALPDASVTATLTCAGNRRSEFSGKPIPGVPWGAGAIGNARWNGPRLSNLLKRAGVKEGAKHVWLESFDAVKQPDGSLAPFGGSVPLHKALADRDGAPGVLLALAMNNQELPTDHGFPVRAVAPGYIGARSVKWLTKIVVSDRPSPNYFMSTAYKLLATDDPKEVERAEPILEYPINAAICVPAAEEAVSGRMLAVKGYALPPGLPDVVIDRVEVSANGGKTWLHAKLTSPKREYCWQLWHAEVPLAPETRRLLVRTTDSRGTIQPETTAWNQKGYLYNAWHRVAVEVK